VMSPSSATSAPLPPTPCRAGLAGPPSGTGCVDGSRTRPRPRHG
jgi:hypothetical protein